MRISFFEEFPTKENLAKLKLVTWKTKLYIAARSLGEFKKVSSGLKCECIYWPILDKREGYWFSPFSQRKAMLRVLNEVKDVPVMIDAELPRRSPMLHITQFFNFFRNRKLIRDFLLDHPGTYVAEYWPVGKIEGLMSFMGLHYDPRTYNNKVIKMFYHSMLPFNEKRVLKQFDRGKKAYGKNFMVGYGTIAKGILGNEPMLSLEQLRKDLELAAGIEEVVIFRLGGLNKEYVSVMCDEVNKSI